jgi:hypothetical protein
MFLSSCLIDLNGVYSSRPESIWQTTSCFSIAREPKTPSTRPALIGIPYATAGKFHFPVFGGWAEETLCPGIAIANCPYYEQHGFSGKQTPRKEDSVTSLEHMLTCMLFYSL